VTLSVKAAPIRIDTLRRFVAPCWEDPQSKEAGPVRLLDTPPPSIHGRAVKYTTIHTPTATPTHLLGWLPLLWTRVLFPGAAAAPGPWNWPPFVVLFLLSGLLLYPCVSFPLFEPDEGRYAQIPREMLTRGEWIVPTLQGKPYLDKPPLFYWLVMVSYAIFGYHDGAARLVPALAMHATVLITYVLGRRILGARPAFWGALLLTVSPIFLGIGRLLVLDGLLTLWVSVSLLSGYLAQAEIRRKHDSLPAFRSAWWVLAALACGLGVLTKGPVALVLLLIPLWLQRRLVPTAAPISRLAWASFAGIVLAVNLPWYALVCVQRPEFLGYFLWQHNVQRFMEPFDHLRPVWFYGPIVLVGLVPALLLTWPMARYFFSTQPKESQERCPGLGFLLLSGSWCVLFFSLAGSKLPTYILPSFVPFCLAAGCFVARTDWHRSRRLWTLVAASWLVLAAAHYFAIPYYARQHSPMQAPETVQAWCGDPGVPVLCFPRNVDSVAFYLGRSDFRMFRSKQLDELLQALDGQQRSVILFGHRHSPDLLAQHLPPHLRMIERRPLGLCEMAVVEKIPVGSPSKQ
jgi:4-amino-4-deoxy-L-arabinose transferase-like glycosyltransferase